MKAIDFRWPLLIVLAGIILLGNLSEPATLGISSGWSDGTYRLAGGTAPWALGSSFAILLLYIWLMMSPSVSPQNPMSGIIRRWTAFWIDFVFAMMIAAPIFGIIPCMHEWRRTGVFEWSFERSFTTPGDGWLVASTLLLMLAAILTYFTYPIMSGKPSPGSCVLGYRVVMVDGKPMTFKNAFLRTIVGIAAALAPYTAFIKRNRKHGQFWLDSIFGTYAVPLK